MHATDERWIDEQRTDATGSAGPEAWHAVGGLHEADADLDGTHDPQVLARLAPAGFETEIVGF